MWDKVGIIRNPNGLENALEVLNEISIELEQTGLGPQPRAFNLSWHDWLNLRNQVLVSRAIATAALRRENSRGAHFRSDFEGEGDIAASRYTIVRLEENDMTESDEAVQFSLVEPGATLIKDQGKTPSAAQGVAS